MPYDVTDDSPVTICPKCGKPILPDQNITLMFAPDGMSSQQWHSECARRYWDSMTPMLRRMRFIG